MTTHLTCAEILAAIPEAYAKLPGVKLPGSKPPDPDKRSDKRSGGKPTVSRRSIVRMEIVDLADEREKADAEATRHDPRLDMIDHRWRDGRDKMTSSPAARRQGILPTLSSWVRLVDSERWDEGDEHQNPPTQRTVPGECGWLTESLDWIEAQQWAHEFRDDLARMLADMNDELGIKPSKPLRCPKCDWYVEARDDGAWYVCTGCSWTWTMANEIDRLLKAQTDILDAVTLTEAAAHLDKPISTLKEWKQRGWILPIGKTRRGYVYDLATVQRVAATVRNGVRTDGRIGA